MPNQIEIYIDVSTGELFNPTTKESLLQKNYPRIQAEEERVLCCNHYKGDRSTVYPLKSTDTFECGGDTGDNAFKHDVTKGTFAGPLTAGETIISLVAALDDPSVVPDTGYFWLVNSDGETERIQYTDFNSSTGVFTVSHTLIYSYADGDDIRVEDEMMFYSDNTKVDIAGDWDEIDRDLGRISIRVSGRSDMFSEKFDENKTTGTNLAQIWLEIRRYTAGSTIPSNTLCSNSCYAAGTIIDHRGKPGNTSIQFLTETSADQRYLQKDFSVLDTKAALVEADTLAVNDSEDSGNPIVVTFTKIWTLFKSLLFPGSLTDGNLVSYTSGGTLSDSGLDPDDIIASDDLGDITESTSSVLTISGGTGAVVGSGVTITVAAAGASQSGYLSATDWNTFNDKQDEITNGAISDGTAAGQIKIWNATNSTWDDAVITAGTNVTVTNADGSITISTSGGGDMQTSTYDPGNYASQVVTETGEQTITNKTLTSPAINTSLTLSYATGSTVPYVDASGNLISSSVTPTELGYISGVTSAIQTQLDAKASLTGSETLTNKTIDADSNTISNIGSSEVVADLITGLTESTSIASGSYFMVYDVTNTALRKLNISNLTVSANATSLQGYAVASTAPANGQQLVWNSTTEEYEPTTPAGGGDVVGPSSATSGNVALFDGTTGKAIKDSNLAVTDSTITIGDGTDQDYDIIVNNGDTNLPRLRYNATNSEWQYSNDGTTFNAMGSGTGSVDMSQVILGSAIFN